MGTGSLLYQGCEIRYTEYGEGERPIVLVHSLLFNRRMFDRIAPRLAARGNRVICIDLLGHGDSDPADDPHLYSTPLFACQVVALLNHLRIDSAVVGGAFLGANVALEVAVREPTRVEGLVLQMPILENALAAVAAFTAPLLLGLRSARLLFESASQIASRIPRSHYLVDVWLDIARRPPGQSADVLEGMLLGQVAPHPDERREVTQPALVLGYRRDPVNPFSDARLLAGELPDARLVETGSPLDWSVTPDHLTDDLARFLDEVWTGAEAPTGIIPDSDDRWHSAQMRVGR